MATPPSSHLQAPPQHRPQHLQQHVPSGGGGGSVRIISGYAIQQRLGSGSFATVYKGAKVAESQGLGGSPSPPNDASVVAIKAITRTSEKLTKKVLENLEMEISILRTYRHPNIVCLHDVQKTERHFYLILEYCAGGDVQKLIRTRKSGRLSERLARRLMRDLSAGLKFLWGQELIHRDIKPQNLLLTGPLPLDEAHDVSKLDADEEMRRKTNFPSDKFALKIADFGFARHLQTASLAETLCGSPLYMAPEILQHHRYDAKADLWSAGTVLFEMIAGRPPFHGENHIDLLRNIQRKAVRLPADVRVSKECVNLLRLLLNRNPLSRAGFKEFFEACDAFVALGCEGVGLASHDEGTCEQPGKMDLGTISENGEGGCGAGSLATVETAVAPHHRPRPKPRLEQTETTSNATATARQCPAQLNLSPSPSSAVQQVPRNARPSCVPEERSCVTPPLEPATAPATLPPNTPPEYRRASNNCDQVVSARQYSQFAPLEPSPPGPKSKILETVGKAFPPPFLLDGGGGAMNQQVPLIPPTWAGAQQQGVLAPAQTSQHMMARSPFQQPHQQHTQDQSRNDSSQNSDDSEFVMVEHNVNSRSGSLSPSTSNAKLGGLVPKADQAQQQRRTPTQMWNQSHQPQTAHPASPRYYGSKPVTGTLKGSGENYSLVSRMSRGMLSTSPATGGALVGMMGVNNPNMVVSTPFQPHADVSPQHGASTNVEAAAKMLAAAEDVGRRSVNVAHLGDTRAYLAMRMIMINEEGSSLLSATPMDGVEEEAEENCDGVADCEDTASSGTPVAATSRRRTVSTDSRTTKHEEEDAEMPFAVPHTEALPVPPSFSPPVRPGSVAVISSSSLTNPKPSTRASFAAIKSHFREALSCYLKALSMMKGAVGAAQRVKGELGVATSPSNPRLMLLKRCEVSLNWLAGQFAGVLERADSANTELGKLQASVTVDGGTTESVSVISVEELIYNHALTCGRDGAVKQLLGQHDAARACYRSAGLLAETLLMEPRLGEEDRRVLEEYVNGFAERITELDELMIQQSRHSASNSGPLGSPGGSRRGSGVVGLVAPPPSQSHLYGTSAASAR